MDVHFFYFFKIKMFLSKNKIFFLNSTVFMPCVRNGILRRKKEVSSEKNRNLGLFGGENSIFVKVGLFWAGLFLQTLLPKSAATNDII